MFDEFVLPELITNCSRVERACYHLDGDEQIKHLDSLLKTSMKLIQWVPSPGGDEDYFCLYDKILDAGRLLMVSDGHLSARKKTLSKIIEQRGSLKGVVSGTLMLEKKDRDAALRYLEQFI